MDCNLPGSSAHGFSKQEYWSGLPFPSPGDLPNPGIKPASPALQEDSLLMIHQAYTKMGSTKVLKGGQIRKVSLWGKVKKKFG